MSLTQRAEHARNQLFARYDALNALWQQAETELRKFHIPHEVGHPYLFVDDNPDYADGEGVQHVLGLAKVKGEWRICHAQYHFPQQENQEYAWTPITDCSAWVRVQAAEHLQELRECVVQTCEDFIPRVDKAITSLGDSLKKF